MAEIILSSGGGSGGADSDDCTAYRAHVLKGYTAIAHDTDDEAMEGYIETLSDSGTTVLDSTTTSITFPVGYYPNAHAVKVNVFSWEG